MRCPKCNKEVSELDEKCTSCGLSFEEYESQKEAEENEKKEVGDKTILLRIIIAIQLIGCFIAAMAFWSDEEIGLGFIVLFGGIVLSAFIKGFIDIIDLLDNINNKIK